MKYDKYGFIINYRRGRRPFFLKYTILSDYYGVKSHSHKLNVPLSPLLHVKLCCLYTITNLLIVNLPFKEKHLTRKRVSYYGDNRVYQGFQFVKLVS